MAAGNRCDEQVTAPLTGVAAFGRRHRLGYPSQVPFGTDLTQLSMSTTVAVPNAVESRSSSLDRHTPIFILGSPRSFTSLVCGMLGQHPETYGMPELNLFINDTVRELLEGLTGFRQIQLHGLLRAVAQLYGGEQTLASVDMARRWLLRRFDVSTSTIYHELCRKVGPLHVVDKSPVYSLKPEYLQRIRTAFPDARYLHLLRHPRTHGESVMKVAKGLMAILANSIDYTTDPPTIDPQISWLDMQERIIQYLETDVPPPRRMRVRGEDVLADPEGVLREICTWLGLRTDADAMEAMLHPENSPYASLGPIGAHLGNDINFLRSPKLERKPGRPSSLEGPLPWRTDGKPFDERTRRLALELGYT
jgi:hypothetical protein